MASANWQIVLEESNLKKGMYYGFRTVPTRSSLGAGVFVPAVVAVRGAGMPPIKNMIDLYETLDGGIYGGSRVDVRTLYLKMLLGDGSNYSSLLAARRSLIDAIKPDRGSSPGMFVIRYNGGATQLEIDGVYDAGLEFDKPSMFVEFPVLRFICPDPFFRESSDSSFAKTVRGSASIGNIIEFGSSGWAALGSGVDGDVKSIVYDTNGNLYAGGLFTNAGGGSANRIAKWNGSAWSSARPWRSLRLFG